MKTIKVLILFAFLSVLTLAVFADGINPLVYEYHNPDITVEFSEPLNVTVERQQQIADNIAGVGPSFIPGSNNELPENIICSLFGHDLSTTTVTATHHKVLVHSPRCLVKMYYVTACSRCDYSNVEEAGSFFIVCCPED